MSRPPQRGERAGVRRLVIVLALAVVAVLPLAPTAADSTAEQQLLWLINEVRSERGLPLRHTVVGFGAVRVGDRWWVTQDFLQPRSAD